LPAGVVFDWGSAGNLGASSGGLSPEKDRPYFLLTVGRGSDRFIGYKKADIKPFAVRQVESEIFEIAADE
jgi:hypothetical protein